MANSATAICPGHHRVADGDGLHGSLGGTILKPGNCTGRAGEQRERAMASVVNLNRFRKAKQAAETERRAAENRAAFGKVVIRCG